MNRLTMIENLLCGGSDIIGEASGDNPAVSLIMRFFRDFGPRPVPQSVTIKI